MFEKIIGLFQQNKNLLGSQSASEATVLLLTLMYRIDRKIKLEEQELLASILPLISWTSTIHINTFQQDAIRRVDAAIKSNQIDQLVSGACASISFKGDLIKLLDEIASVDGNVASDEQQILNSVKSALA